MTPTQQRIVSRRHFTRSVLRFDGWDGVRVLVNGAVRRRRFVHVMTERGLATSERHDERLAKFVIQEAVRNRVCALEINTASYA